MRRHGVLAFTGLPSLFSLHYSTVFRHLALHVFAYLGWIERVKTTFFIIFYFLLWKYEKLSKILQYSTKNILCYVMCYVFLKIFFCTNQIFFATLEFNGGRHGGDLARSTTKKASGNKRQKGVEKRKGKIGGAGLQKFLHHYPMGKLSHWIPNKIKIGDISYTFLDFGYPFFITLLFFFIFFYTLWTFHFIQ